MASSAKYRENLNLIKAIAGELQLALKDYKTPSGSTSKIGDSVRHMFELSKADQATGCRHRPQDYNKYLAETYLTYLRSTRLHDELNQEYFNKGELSVQESARLVGLEVPKRGATTSTTTIRD